MYRPRNISGGFFFIGLALAIIVGHGFFLPIFFAGLAFSTLFGAWETPNCNARYGSLYGFLWLLILALCFLTDHWILLLLGVNLSILLGAFHKPIISRLSAWNMPWGFYQPNSSRYQQPGETYREQSYRERPYNEGYTPASTRPRPVEQPPIERPPTEDEDPYAAYQYNQPQSQYPEQPPLAM